MKDAGRVPAADASRYFAAMDLYLAPFRGGVSTRRGSFMTALQHGVATLSTHGRHTGPTLLRMNEEAFVLTPDDDPVHYRHACLDLYRDSTRRTAIARAGQAYYQATFDWDVLASRFVEALRQPRIRA